MNFLAHYRVYVFAILCLLSITACNSNSESRRSYDTEGMFIYLVDSVTSPKLNTFKESVERLKQSIDLVTENTTLSESNEIKSHWESAARAWKFIETGYVGHLKQSFLMGKVYSLPDVDKIEELLSSSLSVHSTEFLQLVSIKNGGLLTLDYLLYKSDAYNRITSYERYRDVLKRLTELLYENSNQLYNTFLIQHQNVKSIGLSNSTYETSQDALSDYVNSFVLQFEDYRDMYVAKLLGIAPNSTISPENAEARYSGLSKELFLEGVQGFKSFFAGNDTYSFSNLLTERESHLGTELITELNTLESLINNLPDNFSNSVEAHKDEFQNVYDQLTTILRKIKTDIASYLSITIGLSDNDGD